MGLTPGSKCASRLWRFFLADKEGVKSPENCRARAFKVDQITSKRIRYGFITVKSTTLIGAQEHNLAGHKARTDSWSRTAVHVLMGEKKKTMSVERRNLVETA
ncbi:hypothetical protein TNCV_4756861 [Trichonephila clavipes]|nr:hypothetical protein TNCV_4756861 [Trichonephila clavipes]